MLKQIIEPCTVGEILSEEFLKPLSVTQQQLADAMGITRKSVSLLINGKRSLTVREAVQLSGLFETSTDFWINIQSAHDRWEAEQERATAPEISPILKIISRHEAANHSFTSMAM